MADVWWRGLVENVLAHADFNGNRLVDADDLATWEAGFGAAQGALRVHGDADRNGAVDGSDFLIWQAQFASIFMAGPYAVRVPEPHAGPLVMAAWTTLYCRGRLPNASRADRGAALGRAHGKFCRTARASSGELCRFARRKRRTQAPQ